MRYGLILLCCAALLALPTGPVAAQPVCALSSIDPNPIVGLSPVNTGVPGLYQYSYSVILLDAAGLPVVGWPGADVAISIGPPCVPRLIPATGVSSVAGVVTWSAAALDVIGGTCPGAGSSVVIISLGCALPTPIPYVTSPDENRDGIITLGDLSVFRLAFLGGGPIQAGDLNRNGAITLADLDFFRAHFVGF